MCDIKLIIIYCLPWETVTNRQKVHSEVSFNSG